MLKLLLSSAASDITGPEPKPFDEVRNALIIISILIIVAIVIAILIYNSIQKSRYKKEETDIIIICNNCKNIISGKETFCPNCGTKLRNEPNNKNKY